MKILYLANYKNLSGWSQQAVNTILSLDTIPDITVVPRHVNILNNTNPDLPERIKELESNSDRNPDIIIQNVLPSMMEVTTRVLKNVGYFVCESSNFKATGWQHKLNMMSETWVPCYHNKKAALASNVDVATHIVPEATDISKYTKQYPTHRVRESFSDDFIFYTIGEWTTRKNTEAIIKAFHLEFHPLEPVQLFIKTSPGVNIGQKLEEARNDLRLYKDPNRYKRENVQAEFLNEDSINSIHQSCDAFISASHCEAWCIPAIDAMGFGKPVIAPTYGGFADYLTDKNSFPVTGVEDYIWRSDIGNGVPDIYLSSEQWFYLTLKSLREQMRSVYEKKDLVKRKTSQAKEDIKKYSYKSVGKIIENLL